MQHVAKISCRNSDGAECLEEKDDFRREKCNMLQKSLLKTELIKKEFTEGSLYNEIAHLKN